MFVFFQKKVVWRWWTDAFWPWSISLASLLWLTCCCYEFHGMPMRFGGVSAARSASLHRQNEGHLSRLTRYRRGFVHDCNVDAMLVGNPCFWRQKALVASLLTISFYVTFFSSLLSSWKKKISFFRSQIKLQRFVFPKNMKNEFNRNAG